MNYGILIEEISTDPLDRGYAGMTDQQVAESLAASNRAQTVPIPSSELLAWAAADNRLVRIEEAADNAALGAVQSVAKAAALLIHRDGTSLDLSLPDRSGMLVALVTAGVLTQADSDSLTALGTAAVSRAAELGLGRVREGDIQRARA